MHAGLEKGKGVEEQLKYLKAKDTRIPKVEPLSGRKNVWNIPEVIAYFQVLVKTRKVINTFFVLILSNYFIGIG